MNLSDIIELSSSALGLFSSAFFCVGVLHIKDSTIDVIATSFYYSGMALAEELVKQKSEFIFGATLLFLSFMVQVAAKFLPQELASTVVVSSQLYGAALGFGGPTIVLMLIYIPYRRHRTKSVRNLMAAVEGKV